MTGARARRAPSAKVSQAARRNITKAHIARTRLKEPRSVGRVRPVRRLASRQGRSPIARRTR